jgi:hypothetical protein
MEEILSSIRRIIADEEHEDRRSGDDDVGVAEARSAALDDTDALDRAAEEPDDADDDVLELTKVVRESGEVIDLQGERASADAALDDEDAQDVETPRAHDPRLDQAPVAAAPQSEPAAAVRHHIQRKDHTVHSEPARGAELMSATTASVAGGAFAKLSQALQRTPEEESVADSSGRSLEQFIEDIARPMLKEWLDQNLPAIVERLVQKEIQKISRRAELI